MEPFAPGYFDDPLVATPLPEPVLNSAFPNPYATGRPAADLPAAPLPPLLRQPNTLEQAIQAFKQQKPSFQTQTAPEYFNWDKTKAERFVDSDYYKELGFDPRGNNEHKYGYRQTLGNVMGNAWAGAGKLAWNTFIDGWKGWGRMMDALFSWDVTKIMGTPEELEVLHKEQMEIFNKYAIYRTPESESTLFNRQFLGDIIQQSGFTIGALGQFVAEELLTMGMSSFLKPVTGARTIAQLGRAGITMGELTRDLNRAGNLLQETRALEKFYQGLKAVGNRLPVIGGLTTTGTQLSRGIRQGASGWELAGVTFNGLRRTIAEANMALTEARMEAAGTYGDLREKLYDQAMAAKGGVSIEDEQRIEMLSQQAAWDNFGVNALVISAMNRLQFDNLFTTFGSSKRMLREMADQGEHAFTVSGRAARDLTNDAGKVIVQKGDRLQKAYTKGNWGALGKLRAISGDFGKGTAAKEAAKSIGRHALKMEVSEGFQELVQESSNIAVQDYYSLLYGQDPEHPADWDSSIQAGIDAQLTLQGMKTFLMGALTGKLVSPMSQLMQRGSERLTTTKKVRAAQKASHEEAINTINAFLADPSRFAPSWVDNTRYQNKAAQTMERAIRSGSKYLFENAKDDAFAAIVQTAGQRNMLETLTDAIRQYGHHMNEQQFREAFGVDFNTDNRAQVKQYVEQIATEVEAFSRRHQELRDKYADLIQPERYAAADQPKALLMKRALDDTLGIMATSEFRSGRAAKRYTEIMGRASEIPGVERSAHYAFRILGDDNVIGGELALLQQEIRADRQGTRTKEIQQRIRRKQQEIKALQTYQQNRDFFSDNSTSNDKAVQKMMQALRDYVTSKNEEMGVLDPVAPAHLNDLFFRLEDFRRLKVREKKFSDVFNLIAQPKQFQQTYARLLEGLQLQQEQLAKQLQQLVTPATGATTPTAPASVTTSAAPATGTSTATTAATATTGTPPSPGTTAVTTPTTAPAATATPASTPPAAPGPGTPAPTIFEYTHPQTYVNAAHGIQPVVYRVKVTYDGNGQIQSMEFFNKQAPQQVQVVPPFYDKGLTGAALEQDADLIRYFALLAQLDYFTRLTQGGLKQQVTKTMEAASGKRKDVSKRMVQQQVIPAILSPDGQDMILLPLEEALLQELTTDQVFEPDSPEEGKDNYQAMVDAVRLHLVGPLEQLKKDFTQQATTNQKAAKSLFRLEGHAAVRVFTIPGKTPGDLDTLLRTTPPLTLMDKLSVRVSRNPPGAAPKELFSGTGGQVLHHPSPLNLELLHDNQVVGFLSHPHALVAVVGGTNKYLGELTPAEYNALFVSTASFAEVKAAYNSSLALVNTLETALGNQASVTITPSQLQSVAFIQVSPGEYDFRPDVRPLQELAAAGHEVIAIVDKRIADQPLVLTTTLTRTQQKTEEAVRLLQQEQFAERTKNQGRYSAMIRLPNGQIRFVELVSTPFAASELETFLQQLQEQAQRTVLENVIINDKQKPVAADVQYNNAFNDTLLNGRLFLALPLDNKGMYITTELTATGDLQLTFFQQNKKDGRHQVYINYAVLRDKRRVKTFKDLLTQVNIAITNYNTTQRTQLPVLKAEYFRHSISAHASFDELMGQVTNVSPQVVKNQYLSVFASKQAVTPIDLSQTELTAPSDPGASPQPASTPLTAINLKELRDTETVEVDPNELKPQPATAAAQQLQALKAKEEAAKTALRQQYEDAQGVIKDIPGYTRALKAITDLYQAEKAKLTASASKRIALKADPGYGVRDVDDLSTFRNWVARNLPATIRVEELDTLTERLGQGNILLGRFNTWMKTIEVSPRNAYKYHEAFHAVFRLLLTDAQIDQLLAVARYEVTQELRRQGRTLAQEVLAFRNSLPLYESLSQTEAAERYLEEWLADRFHAWKQTPRPEQPSENALIRFFRKLLSWIRSILLSRQALPHLFKNIDKGKFRNSQVADNRFTREVGDLNPLEAYKIAYEVDYITDSNGHVLAVKKYLSESDTNKVVGGMVNTFLRRTEGLEAYNKKELLEDILNDYQQLYVGKPYTGLTAEKIDRLELFRKIFSEATTREQLMQSADQFLVLLGFDQHLESDEVDAIHDDMGDRRTTDHWDETHSFGGFKSLSSYVRKYIQSTAYEGEDEFGNAYLDERTGERLLVGVNAGIIYNGLLKISAGVTSAPKFIQRLQIYQEENPECRAFVTQFIEDTGLQIDPADGSYTAAKDPRLFNAIYKAFTLFQVDYMTLRVHPGQGMDIKLSNRRDAASNQYNRWQNAFIFSYQDQVTQRPQLKADLLQVLRSLSIPFQVQASLTEEDLATYISNHLGELQRLTGIRISRNYFTYSVLTYLRQKNLDLSEQQQLLLDSFSEVEPITGEDIGELTKTIAADENPFINFDRLYDDVPPAGKEMDTTDEDHPQEAARGQAEIDQSLGKGNETRLRKLAKNNALFDESVLATSWTNAEGKTVWSHQLPTFHLSFLEAYLKDPQQLLQYVERDPYLAGTYFGSQVLSGDPSSTFNALVRQFSIRRIDGMRQITATVGKDGRLQENRRLEYNKKEGITYGDFRDRELILTLIGLYMEPDIVPVQIPDRQDPGHVVKELTTTRHLIRVLEASNTGDTINLPVIPTIRTAEGKITLSDAAKEAIAIGVENEYNRIREVARAIADDKTGQRPMEDRIADFNDYQQANSKMRGLKFWNYSNLLGASSTPLETRASQKYDQPMRPADKQAAIERIEASLLGDQGLVDQFMTLMVEAGVVTRKANGQYANELLPPAFFGSRRKQPERLSGLHLKGTLRENVAQFFINDFINTASFNELLLGDQARSLKDFIDAVKRAKGANASGPDLSADITAPHLGIHERFDTSFVHIHKDQEYQGTYSGTKQKRTDAQLWATTKAHRYMEFALGRLTTRSADFIDRVELGLELPPGALFDADGSIRNNYQLSVKKVVYYDSSLYIKTSMFVLTKRFTSYLKPAVKAEVTQLLEASDQQLTPRIRELCSNNDNWLPRPDRVVLHNKRVVLETWEQANQRVAFSIPESAAKMIRVNVGSDLIHFRDGGFRPLDNRFWRLQSENPSNKLSITDPTQARQLIDSEQQDSTSVYYRGVKTSVGELRRLFQADSARRVQLKYTAARNQIFSIEALEEELATSVDLGKVTPKLAAFQEHALEMLQQSGATSQLLELFQVTTDPQTGERAPQYDLNHPLTLNKYIQLFLAYFRTHALSEKIPGHALTLVSDFGVQAIKRVKRVNQQGQPIEWDVVPSHLFEKDPAAYVPTRQLGTDPFEPGDLFVDDLRYNVPEYDEQGTIIGRYTEFMMPAHFRELLELGDQPIPEALKRAFGVRIPSQDKHSFITLKLVDFMPAELGSAGIFPKELIEISGADFDVDKLMMQIADFFILTMRNENNDPQHTFIRYGDQATTAQEKHAQYLRWNREKNPHLKKVMERLADRDSALRDLIAQREELRRQKRSLNRSFTQGKPLSMNDLQARNGLNEQATSLDKDIGQAYQRIETAAFQELGIPITQRAFEEKTNQEGELNIGVLNNRLLDNKIQLLTNDYQQQEGIPTEVANLQPLEAVEADPRVRPGVIEEKNLDIDNPLGKVKAFVNNKEGQSNIAPAVNSMLTFTFLNKYGIRLRTTHAGNTPFYRVSLNGHTFEGYHNTRSASFDKKGNFTGYKGPRIFNVISAIITAMTDNAKERKAAKLNLNIDAVGIASNLITQGFPKEEAIALLLSPAVKTYYQRLRGQQYAVRTGTYHSAARIMRDLLQEYQEKAGGKNVVPQALTSSLLFDNLRPGQEDMLASYSTLYHYDRIIEQTSYFSDIAQLLKLSKGLGTELEEWDDNIKRRAERLGLFDDDIAFQKREAPFDIRDAIWNKHTSSSTYLKIALQLEKLSKTMIITRSGLFNTARTAVLHQLNIPPYLQKRFQHTLSGHLMLFFGLKAYLRQLSLRGDELLPYLDNRLIHEHATDYKDIIDLVEEGKRLQPRNYLLNFLHANPTMLTQKGQPVDNPNNRKGIQLVEANTWAKLDAYQLDKLQNAFVDLYSNEATRPTALGLFAYTIVKDGTLFRNDSLLQLIPTFMLDELLGDIMVNVRNIFKRDDLQQYIENNPSYAGQFNQVFGTDFKGMMEQFYQLFLPHVTNAFYIPKIVLAGKVEPGFAAPVTFADPQRDTIALDLFDQVRQKMLIQVASADGITWEEAARTNKKLNAKELQRFYQNLDTLRKKGFTLRKKEGRWMVRLPYIIKVRRGEYGYDYYRLDSTSEVTGDQQEQVVPLRDMLQTDDWQIWGPKAVYRKTSLQGVSAQTALARLFGEVPATPQKRSRVFGYKREDLSGSRSHPVDRAQDIDEMAVLAGAMTLEDYQAIKAGKQPASSAPITGTTTNEDFAGYTPDFFGEPAPADDSRSAPDAVLQEGVSAQLKAKGYTFRTVKGVLQYFKEGKPIAFAGTPQELLEQLQQGKPPAANPPKKKGLLGAVNLQQLREGETYVPDPEDKKNPLNCKRPNA